MSRYRNPRSNTSISSAYKKAIRSLVLAASYLDQAREESDATLQEYAKQRAKECISASLTNLSMTGR